MEASEIREIVSKGVREEAARKHAQYPQYEGHWDGDEWYVVRLKRAVRTKMGQAFEKGELTIARDLDDRERVGDRSQGSDSVCAYSLSNGIDTWVRREWVEVL
jgi:hypothetical protein